MDDSLEKLLALHVERAREYFRLSLAASYASLFFLIDLEGLLPPQSHNAGWLLHAGWIAAFVSVAAGSLHLTLEMLLPLHNKKLAEDLRGKSFPNEQAYNAEIDSRIQRNLCWNIFFWAHLICLSLVLPLVCWYKFSNV
jgi:hypothetical protein